MAFTTWSAPSLLAAYQVVEGTPRELPPIGYPDWPAGSLRSSRRDFARLLAVFTNEGTVNGHPLQSATVQAMLTPQPGVVVAPGNPTIQ